MKMDITERVGPDCRNWKKCDRRMPVKPKTVYKTVIRPVMVYVADKLATKKRQEKRIDVNEIRILGWMYEVTRRKDKTRNEHICE